MDPVTHICVSPRSHCSALECAYVHTTERREEDWYYEFLPVDGTCDMRTEVYLGSVLIRQDSESRNNMC